jgi:hypothetical protein
VLTIFAGFVTTVWLQLRVEAKRDAEIRRDKLSPEYARFIKLVREIGQTKGSKRKQEEANKTFADCSDRVLLWGTPRMISTWAGFMRMINANPGDGEKFVAGYTVVLHEFRRELGHDDHGLPVRDLARLFLDEEGASSIDEDATF